MPTAERPDLDLFVSILHTLEELVIPYAIIGAFAGTLYGLNRVTQDIDIIVALSESHIPALAERYPPPRYYADPLQMREAVAFGIMFNIIDSDMGDKADLIPVTMKPGYHDVLTNRVRQRVELPGKAPFEVWCARREDVIIGKLRAWQEGRSRKHETDIYDILVFYYLGLDAGSSLDEQIIDETVEKIGPDAVDLWEAVKNAAHVEADDRRDETP